MYTQDNDALVSPTIEKLFAKITSHLWPHTTLRCDDNIKESGVRNINTTGPSRDAVWVMTKEGHFGNEEHCGKSDIVRREGGAAVNAVVSSTEGRQEMRQVNYGLLCAFYDVVARRTPCQRSWQAMTTTTDTWLYWTMLRTNFTRARGSILLPFRLLTVLHDAWHKAPLPACACFMISINGDGPFSMRVVRLRIIRLTMVTIYLAQEDSNEFCQFTPSVLSKDELEGTECIVICKRGFWVVYSEHAQT